ncbi:MAG TPA: error-prone DNA polymerase [Cyclobacteriaceae bacterium]|nr:error-prone DNA polymerase [Cyclobacteriaceae bacterium]
MSYTELQVTSNFTFLRGASHPQELVNQAHEYGYSKIAITDRNTFAGIVRAHVAAKSNGMKIIPACRLDLLDGPSLLALPTDIQAYSQISNLLTVGNLRTEKGKCDLYKADLYDHAKGSKFIVIPPPSLNETFDFDDSFKKQLEEYRDALGDRLYIAASRSYTGDDSKQLYRIAQLAKNFAVPMVATNDVHYHNAERRELQDIVTCVREKCTIHNAGFRLHPNAERYLKPVDEMLRLFRQYPDAIRQTEVISEACTFSLDQLKYNYPKEVIIEGQTPMETLKDLTWSGATEIYKGNIPDKVKANIAHEMGFIEEMNYAEYFLTVYDIVRYARSLNILCQGRGSAANSTICYCLGITSVDPSKFELLFERFISSARNEPPDIDVDFEHERREEVMQYIYNKYGRHRAAVVATVTQLHHKGAIRDVGKAMGLSVDTINRMSALIWDFADEGFDRKRITDQGLNPDDPTIMKVLNLTAQYMGFPRQLGQHTGGFVITEGRLSDLCPILNARMEDRTNIEWNKDDIDALKFLKIDVLALGMLTCIRKAFDMAKKHYGKDFTLANIPQDDPAVYEMVSHADTIGVFQIESRAQMSMLPRLRPNCFYDLVIEVAIVRPGPIQGDMVHPYLRRRNGEEPVVYPSKELEEILGRTLGVPLFQEQAMKIAIVAAKFTPAEADELRRSMATFKAVGKIAYFEQKLIKGMTDNGYTVEYAKRVFRQLEGFGSYGFPESHAVSFALLVYISSWLKCYYPDVFACALLNSMPMGFYQPAQIIIDAKKHGVEVLPVDVNYSEWDNTLEKSLTESTERHGNKYEGCAVRLGFRQVKGLREEELRVITESRTNESLSASSMNEQVTEKSLSTPSMNEHVTGKSLSAPSMNEHVTGKSLSTPSMNEDVTEKSLSASSMNEHVTEKSLSAPSMSEHGYGKSLSVPSVNEHVTGKSLSTPSMNEHVTEKSLSTPSMNEDVTGKSLSTPSMNEDVTGKSLSAPSMNEQVTEKSLSTPSMNEDVTGKSLSAPSMSEHGCGKSLSFPAMSGESRSKRFRTLAQLRDTGLSESILEKLADADAFRSLDHDRREALWEVSTKDHPKALFKGVNLSEGQIELPKMTLSEHVVQDYATTSLSLKGHPVSFVRQELDRFNVRTLESLKDCKDGDMVRVAGLILVRQRPGTASGICFITIEDETASGNLVVWQSLFDKYRPEIIQSRLLMVEGKLQIEGEVVHVIVQRCFNFNGLLKKLTPWKEELEVKKMKGDEVTTPFLKEDVKGEWNSEGGMQKKDGSETGWLWEGRNFR